MGKSAASPPPPPDPYATARAQTGSNVATSISNSATGNANVYSPLGTSEFNQRGTYQIQQPHYDSQGNPVHNADGSIMMDNQDVPLWEQHVTLSPEQQRLYDQQTNIGIGMNDLAKSQIDRLQGVLNKPLDLSGMPDERWRYENAMFDRMAPQLQQDRAALDAKLVNQGLVSGTGAYDHAMDQYNRQVNDARLAVVGQGGNEQAQALQMALAARNQPINEITALMAGGQVNMPQFQPFQAGQVAGTPVGDYVYKSADIAQKNYQIQQQANAASMGGLFGLGSNALGLLMKSDRRLKRDIRRLGVRLRNGLDLYAYRYIDGEDYHAGVMADEVAAVAPRAVHWQADGFAAVDYGAILA